MKKVIIFLAVICVFNLKAQDVKVEKAGVVLTKEVISKEYFLENTTTDSIKIMVVNHQEKVDDLGNGVIAISDGEHAKVDFTIPPKTKMGLNYIICVHSTGILIGPDNYLLEYKFYKD